MTTWQQKLFTAALVILGATTMSLPAQKETAVQRAVYAEVNESLSSYQKARATVKDDPTVFELDGWHDGTHWRKVKSVVPGEDGGGFEEYYFGPKGELVFTYNTYRTTDGKKPDAVAVENRCYFKGGKMFRWLVQPGSVVVKADSADFSEEATRLQENAARFVKVLDQKSGLVQPSKAANEKTLEGVFLRVDEGDYFHWVMKPKAGEEQSFFILQADATVEKVVNDPETYVGKRCRVIWTSSKVNIPEAGGKIDVSQILRVEWLKP